MLSKVVSSAVQGIEAYRVDVETSIANGLPHFSTVGLPDNAVRESKDRVEAAIRQSGFTYPYRRVTINVAPADVRKAGSSFDLPIAVGILSATGQTAMGRLEDTLFAGELSLDGAVRPIRGVLSMAVAAARSGIRAMIVPEENVSEAAMVQGLRVYG
ncbi:MAG: hypothetical protein FJY97_21185, partial [candidate division Zixibacteria bacterium]|nr:hypothetical protein [candidate division Zixibacteria bacterium]